MIRHSEAVLAGHPDKFCDQIADAIVGAAYAVDPEAYAQVEVSTWSDQLWINGGVVTRDPFDIPLEKLLVDLGVRIGYCRDVLRYRSGESGGNSIDVEKYRVTDALCRIPGDPREWTRHVNDQSLVIGWAGYDSKVRYLPPEHFLAHVFREALDRAFTDSGRLARQGPDGKLLVRLRENHAASECRKNTWELEQVLVTVQQRPEMPFGGICEGVAEVLEAAYEGIVSQDARWMTDWRDVAVVVNPNGPLVNGGSEGDNGQTGRKLVMDYYGPRVPMGGGALSGKDLTHIDRAGAYAARRACVEALAEGGGICEVLLAYAPGRSEPLDVRWSADRRVPREVWDSARFSHAAARDLALSFVRSGEMESLGRGNHFFSPSAPWNTMA